MIIALILYAAICLLLLGIAVKLVMIAFRRPDQSPESLDQSPATTSSESPTKPLSASESPRQRRKVNKGAASVSRDDLVEKLERQFHNSPSLSSNPEE